MTVNITIIGLGKIGTSAGLALGKHTNQVYRLGHDIVPENARLAQKMGAVDKVVYNLPASVRDADLVFLALPVDQIRETLRIIGPDLREGGVVVDTAPVKVAVASWAKELLPQGRFYVGLTPVLNPAYLNETATGTEAGREDLFEKSLFGIVAPPRTDSAALKLASDLTNLLGAEPFFMDMVEVDSLMTMVHLIPQLVAAGMVSATVSQPGWLEGRKIAGVGYAQVGHPLNSMDSPDALGEASLLNQEHVIRLIDNVIADLQDIRDNIAEGDKLKLVEKLKTARKGREVWWDQRLDGNWSAEHRVDVEIPTSGEEMRRWIFGRRRQDPKV